jgi:hypothetical protein
MKATPPVARIAFVVLAFVALAYMSPGAQTPVIELGVERDNHEAITVTQIDINEIPPGAIYLGEDMHFEQVPVRNWYGEDPNHAFRTFLNPLDGLLHLRQQWGWSMVYQNIDISVCSPIYPVWFYSNTAEESENESGNDVHEGIVFNALTGNSIATLWTHWNQQGSSREYGEVRVRVDGLVQVAQIISLAIGADFNTVIPGLDTKFDTDRLTVACLPIGWVPSSYVYLPLIVTGH